MIWLDVARRVLAQPLVKRTLAAALVALLAAVGLVAEVENSLCKPSKLFSNSQEWLASLTRMR